MGIVLASNFDVNAGLPLDSRDVVADVTARDAIVSGRRYIGMVVHVLSTSQNWQLQGGILNANWTIYGASAPVANYSIDTFAGNGSTTAFTLTSAPAAKSNVDVHISGGYQEQSTWTLSGTTLTFSAAPPASTTIEVSYGVTSAVVADGSITLAKMATANKALSSTCSVFSTTSTSFVDVTSLSTTLTCTGRLLQFKLISDGTGTDSLIGVVAGTGPNTVVARFIVLMDGVTEVFRGGVQAQAAGAGQGLFIPSSSINGEIDGVAAGSHTFKVQMIMLGSGAPTGYCYNSKLQIRELP